MSVSLGKSFSVTGISAKPISIEVDIRKGLPSYSTVGLPDKAVKESKNRINAAIKNSGFEFPVKKITVNLAPADLKKEGSSFDFPIALGILAATGQIKEKEKLKKIICIGELSLDGHLRRVPGALPAAMKLKKYGCREILLPETNQKEAAVVEGIKVIPVHSLRHAVSYLNGEQDIEPASVDIKEEFKSHSEYNMDFSDIRGQYFAKRALEVAAAGGHNLLMTGPPGAGKTMLAKRFVTILPRLTVKEAIEVTMIKSVAGTLKEGEGISATRPFRTPHHTISDIALVGGGSIPHPGEISLAHRGVLFLDEFPEFKRGVIEVLRQPLEDGQITVSRAAETVTYPANFSLIAAMNPCPCGYYGVPRKDCRCTSNDILKYKSKISGPILDRIDIDIEVPRVKKKEMETFKKGEKSDIIRERVEVARLRQEKRFKDEEHLFSNADMKSRDIRKLVKIEPAARELLNRALDRYGLSVRSYNKILKVSRTIADLAGKETVDIEDVTEALQYRSS
ncbi:MAG: YifB family Mg chelatase-like AAA ATPase [Elusimicrobiota bacterium]|nr:YifB family Mg chelatase-like AAA ATPase [Elusimicrobiota bacterium]